MFRRRDGEPIVLERKEHYEGGTPDQTTLLIKNSTRHDHGLYTCELENSVGKGNSSNGVYVNIQCEYLPPGTWHLACFDAHLES